MRPNDSNECEHRKQSIVTDIVLRYKKEIKALRFEMSPPSDFGLNNAETKKMSKYQDLKI